jgi:hypothetical protein
MALDEPTPTLQTLKRRNELNVAMWHTLTIGFPNFDDPKPFPWGVLSSPHCSLNHIFPMGSRGYVCKNPIIP